MQKEKSVDALSSSNVIVRLNAIKKLKGEFPEDEAYYNRPQTANCQIHTKYSFSPYTPSLAAYMSKKFGLKVAGIMDNYTLGGAKEFIKACRILNITYTVGVEIRAEFPLEEYPVADIAVLGIAAKNIKDFQREIKPFRDNQKHNNLSTFEAVNKKMKKYGIQLDYKADVLPKITTKKDKVYLSKYVYFALAEKLIDKYKKGKELADFVTGELGLEIASTEYNLLCSVTNPYYWYDLVNIIFNNNSIFHAKKSYANYKKIIDISHKYGAICSFEFPLREKTQDYNDKQIEKTMELIDKLKNMGFDAVSYDVNRMRQEFRDAFAKRLYDNEMLGLNLSRIEFPRRKFDYNFPDEITKKNMMDAAFAIVGSEMCENQTKEGFVLSSKLNIRSFKDRIALFAKIGRKGN